MENLRISMIVFFIISMRIYCQDNNGEVNGEDFVATNEWQVVKKGQKIPQGLHVRMDLTTGVTEAKLLDNEDENNGNSNAIVHIPQSDESIESKQISKSELKERIDHLPNDGDSLDPEQIKSIKYQFRDYDELKKTLDELNLTPRLDSEIISELLTKHDELSPSSGNREEILKILEDLDFLTHQYDNAIEFVDRNGFKRLIYKHLNSTNNEILSKTLQLLSTIIQNNNKPKIHALETGCIVILLRFINSDPDVGIKLRALTALSSLLRSFPVAQRKFIENGGLTTINFEDDNNDIKIQIKIATMISDLVTEHQYAANDEKLKPYYYSFDFINYVLQQNWCENLNKLLYRLMIVDNQDHDSLEKCLIAMHSLRNECSDKFDKNLLTRVQLQYKILTNVEDNEFLNNLKRICDEIVASIRDLKTEL